MGCLVQILFAGLLVAAVSAAPQHLQAPHPLAEAHDANSPSTAVHEDTETTGHEEAQNSEHHSFKVHGEEETPEHDAEGEHETESEPELTISDVRVTKTEIVRVSEDEHETEAEPEHTFGAVHGADTESEHVSGDVHTEPEHTFGDVHSEPEHTFTAHDTHSEPEHTFTAHDAHSEQEHVPEDAHATVNDEVTTTEEPASAPFGHDATPTHEEGHAVPPFGFKDHHESEDVLPELPPAPHSAPTFGHH